MFFMKQLPTKNQTQSDRQSICVKLPKLLAILYDCSIGEERVDMVISQILVLRKIIGLDKKLRNPKIIGIHVFYETITTEKPNQACPKLSPYLKIITVNFSPQLSQFKLSSILSE